MEHRYFSTRDAANMVGGISEATLRNWGRQLGIHTSDDPADQRVHGWTLGELQRIANFKGRRLGKPPAEPEPSRRMRALEHEHELLKARVARVEAHLGLV